MTFKKFEFTLGVIDFQAARSLFNGHTVIAVAVDADDSNGKAITNEAFLQVLSHC
jgi:hypothetical protein